MAPLRSALSHAGLYRWVSGIVAWLNHAGIQRGDRVAMVLPNGPEMALAFLGVSSTATSAPLNPAYHRNEFEFYLRDLNAKALIVQPEVGSEAVAAAHALGIRVIELSPVRNLEAGVFTLDGDALAGDAGDQCASPEDIALLLHTSGTTSRPKIVPLSHINLCASARNVSTSLALTEADRCLNVMPLFHIHGLVAALLAPLCSGGSVVCTTGFDGNSFFRWVDEFKPSWYTAVPTMHQEVVRRAAYASDIIAKASFRFIRSSSSALPDTVLAELEATFGAPVIEAYGMTEAAHQMASNPLPPVHRKPGSVGIATGTELAIMNENGDLLPAGKIGEVVGRGKNLTPGYENNPDANAAAFSKGWFRTGDQGIIDSEGYLSLNGRLKEIIDQGGEKIAPREIDEVLLKHPAVAQAVAFAVSHPTLGEAVAAAVVQKDGTAVTELELRDFALQHLPAFKVPARFAIVAEIPKGPTGKIQRIGLAEKLASKLEIEYEPPVGQVEQMSASIFEDVLRRTTVGRNDNFFALGGDSIRAMQVVARLIENLGIEIPATILFHRPTPALLAHELSRLQEAQDIACLAAELRKLSPNEATRLLDAEPGDNV